MSRVGASLLIASALAVLPGVAANAAKLPQIKADQSNSVPACVTPGRLMAFLNRRNGRLASKFRKIASEYMRHGEALGIRWDQAFYQMVVETNSLKYGNDVSEDQNNFAGLGATGGGEPGESFQNVSDGVKAHLQHVLMYSGEHIDNPVAERTRKVQSWGILDNWRDNIGRPLTYTDLTRKWSPGDRGYSRDIKVIGDRFMGGYCNKSDPHPEWLAELRGGGKKMTIAKTRTTGQNLADAALRRGKRGKNNSRAALGAKTMAAAGAVPFTILNSKQAPADTQPRTKTAAAGGGAMLPKGSGPGQSGAQNADKNLKCNVFTASYGGQKAVIIKAISKGAINYTVLDINAGKEKTETEAYIAAYAKGGTTVGTYSNQAQALDKAFELCPEG